ncbi:MAG: cysteine desulfurase family protein [Bacteroidota bacterium]
MISSTKQRYYFDNAATTPIDPQVLEAMMPYLQTNFGNPSSIHSHGREVRSAIEKARKTVANLLNCSTSEIFFTSGGTEADNTAIINSVIKYDIKQAITSKIEHHAVLHTLQSLENQGVLQVSYVNLDEKGNVDLVHLEQLLAKNEKSIVSLMHGNNEIGNLIDFGQLSEICNRYNTVLHSDTVQTMGHYVHDLQKMNTDFIVGAAHKFHGPKGVGFLYINGNLKIEPYLHGGSQERNMRGGTENVYGIIGLAKALEIAYEGMESHQKHIEKLKVKLRDGLSSKIPNITFNGESADLDKSLYTVLNVSFPPMEEADMLLFNLDINKISASGGSACTSGSNIGSHVLTAIGVSPYRPSVRFSFSKYNTEAEVDYLIEKVGEIIEV